MSKQTDAILTEALEQIKAIGDDTNLQEWKTKYLGQRGMVKQMFQRMRDIAAEERAEYGRGLNTLKATLQRAYEERQQLIQLQSLMQDLEEGDVDITLPGKSRTKGGYHPSTQTLREFQKIWADMGFQVFQSRDVEDDETNYTLLNMPPHHPARDMQDTFYTTTPNVILRTHTSAGQIHAMRQLGGDGSKPIRVILPGMCYRYENITTRSEVQFYQVEGLAVGRNIRMSDLKGTITEFAKRLFGADVAVRFRASYFPFTEPSMEIDVECFLCSGQGCKVCKYTGWLEIAGSGMVHPTVLRNGGYDPSEWSGFAFGMGPERMTMLKHRIEDIRYFWRNDLRFLEQF